MTRSPSSGLLPGNADGEISTRQSIQEKAAPASPFIRTYQVDLHIYSCIRNNKNIYEYVVPWYQDYKCFCAVILN